MRWFACACAVALLTPSGVAAQGGGTGATRILSGLEEKYYLAGRPRREYTLAERMKAYRVPAVSIAVIDRYHIVWTYAAGLGNVAARAPATTTTLFQAASMSKPVAAAGILRLFEVKHLRLDADVNTLLRSWHVAMPANSTQFVTMRRLLSHSAGINVHGFAGYDRDATLPTLIQVLDGAPPANSPPIRVVATPGSETQYSGGGTSIAQQVAVDVSGEPFAPFMQQTLLAPLGMAHSTFDQPLPQSLWASAADGYYAGGKPVHRGWHVYPTMAAAGLWTTPADLATFVIAIQEALRGRGKGPIDATVAREMTTKASDGFGLGLGVQPGYFAHNGANEGFQGLFMGLDTEGRGVVVLTNSDNGVLLADEIVHSVASAYRWPVMQPQPKTAISLSETAMRDVAGSYAAKLGGEDVRITVTLRESAGVPALYLGTSLDSVTRRLYAQTPLRCFTLSGVSLDFARAANGRIDSLKTAGTTFRRV